MLRAFGLLALLLVATPTAPARAQTPEVLVDQGLALSGARSQLAALAPEVRARLARSGGRLDPDAQDALEGFLARALRPDGLYALVRSHFREHLDRDRLDGALQWLRSPVGRKIARLEAKALGPEAEGAMREFEAELGARAASSERFVLVNRLMEATNQPEFALEIVRALAGGLGAALERAPRGERAARLAAVEQAVGGALAQPRAAADQAALTFLLFAYRGARDAELDQYLAFVQSAAGRWFGATWREAVLRAVNQAATRAAAELARPPRRP